MIEWGTVADWLVGVGTLLVAGVAAFQETIRSKMYKPEFQVSAKTEPPDCVAVPFSDKNGNVIADSFYLRIWVENTGNAPAKKTEVYAKELRQKRLDGTWERVRSFPNMNLVWSNLRALYCSIAPETGKHCDVAHVTDPKRRGLLGEHAPQLKLNTDQTSLAFDLITSPNNKNHIVGPGEYLLDILVAAENCPPVKRTLTITLSGSWNTDEAAMLRYHLGIGVLP